MHEFSLINDLMWKIDAIAREQGARRVVGVKVRLGALSHISPDHFREHFEAAATGTIAEAARLDFETPWLTPPSLEARKEPDGSYTLTQMDDRAWSDNLRVGKRLLVE